MSLKGLWGELERGLLVLRVTVAGLRARKVCLAADHRAEEAIVVADILLSTLGSLHSIFLELYKLERDRIARNHTEAAPLEH